MIRVIACLLAVCVPNSQVMACCMLPETYDGTIRQNAHEGVIMHSRGREELVLRINYKISGQTMPDHFAWVITVPTEPDHYALADAEILEDMFKLSEKLLRKAPKKIKRGGFGAGAFGGGAVNQDVELGKRVQVGPYDIQPVRGVGANALTGLNTWLKEKGFPSEDPKHMKYFVENKFTFLCVKIDPSEGEKVVKEDGLLPPLHLSFASPKPYYPLRFSSRQGVFKVNLHVLTQRTLNYRSSNRVLKQINWSNSDFKRNVRLNNRQWPESLKTLMAETRFKSVRSRWFYNNIRADKVNLNDSIAKWETDVFLNGQPAKMKPASKLK